MHKISLLTLGLMFLTVAPIRAITHHTWQTITGLSAVGGAIAGIALYNALREKKHEKYDEPDKLIIGQESNREKKKRIQTQAIIKSIGSAIVGAAAGAAAFGWWFWSYTARARHEKAQEFVQLALNNPLIANPGNLANPAEIENAIRLHYVRNGEEFNRALWEMTTHQHNLQQAQHLCAQALADSHDEVGLPQSIGNTQIQVRNLLEQVNARLGAIRMSPAYEAELRAARERNIIQAELWRGYDYHYRPRLRNRWVNRVEVEVEQVFVPRPVIIQHHVVQQPIQHVYHTHTTQVVTQPAVQINVETFSTNQKPKPNMPIQTFHKPTTTTVSSGRNTASTPIQVQKIISMTNPQKTMVSGSTTVQVQNIGTKVDLSGLRGLTGKK